MLEALAEPRQQFQDPGDRPRSPPTARPRRRRGRQRAGARPRSAGRRPAGPAARDRRRPGPPGARADRPVATPPSSIAPPDGAHQAGDRCAPGCSCRRRCARPRPGPRRRHSSADLVQDDAAAVAGEQPVHPQHQPTPSAYASAHRGRGSDLVRRAGGHGRPSRSTVTGRRARRPGRVGARPAARRRYGAAPPSNSTSRCTSTADSPAAGSSSSSSRGRPASAIAISSCRRCPCDRCAGGCRSASGQAHRSSSRPAGRGGPGWPYRPGRHRSARGSAATITLSSAVSVGQTAGRWWMRPMPSRARPAGPSRVTSRSVEPDPAACAVGWPRRSGRAAWSCRHRWADQRVPLAGRAIRRSTPSTRGERPVPPVSPPSDGRAASVRQSGPLTRPSGAGRRGPTGRGPRRRCSALPPRPGRQLSAGPRRRTPATRPCRPWEQVRGQHEQQRPAPAARGRAARRTASPGRR